MKTTVDSQRIDSFISKMEARLEEVKKFRADRLETLNTLVIPKLEFITKIFSAEEITLENVYSSHFGDNECSNEACLLVHGTIKLSKVYKNVNLLCSKMDAAWSKSSGRDNANIHFNCWDKKAKVEGSNTVSIELWIK